MYYDNTTVTYLLVLLDQLFQVFLCNPKISQKNIGFSISFDIIIILHLTTFTGFHHVLLTLPGLPGGPCNPAVSSDNLSKNSMNFILVLISLGSWFIAYISLQYSTQCKNSNIPRKTAAHISLRSSSEYSRP